jgi:hypothetical protein
MENEIAWIDRNYKEYSMDEILDSHLLNILRFMCKGGGYSYFLTTEKIINLFDEANKRNLKHSNKLIDALESRDLKDLMEEIKIFDEDIE